MKRFSVALPVCDHRWGRSPSFKIHFNFYYILMFQTIHEDFVLSIVNPLVFPTAWTVTALLMYTPILKG
jgi:hypothetical protein